MDWYFTTCLRQRWREREKVGERRAEWGWEVKSRGEWEPNSEGWFCGAALQRETALHLTYLLFAQFPLCMTVHLGSGCSLPMLLSCSPHEIIANPALPTPKSDRAKRPCALFKISNEQTCVPVAASHYKTQTDLYQTPFCSTNDTEQKGKKEALWSETEVMSTENGLLSYCVLADGYSMSD